MRIKEDAGGDVHVLYVDHQGHPAPLSLCYHATASRRLSSSVDRHPPSTLCEVDSAYCPQCLSFYDAETSASTGYCFKPSCRICPVCQSIASISADETDCFYKCGKCKWTSRHCVIYTTLSVDNQGKYAKDDFNKAVVELGDQSISRVADQDRLAAQHFTTRMAALEGFAKEQVKGQRTTAGHLTPEKLSRWEGWNVQDLETFLDSRGSRMKKSSAEISGAQEGSKISSDNEQELPNGSTVGQLPIALLVHLGSSSTLPEEGLLPRLIPLRPRKSRRCRAELVDGRPGILLKPKLNPLEGDSCLKTGHGQWWKKVRHFN
jgi:dynactin 4